MNGQLLTAAEVAAQLATTPKHVRELRRLDPSPLPAINVSAGTGRPSWRWRPSTVDAFLRQRRAA